MAIRIEITVNDDCPYEDIRKAVETQMRAIGFIRSTNVILPVVATERIVDTGAPSAEAKRPEPPTGSQEVRFTDKPDLKIVKTPAPNEPPLAEMDGERKRGEAAPGHRRRTNAQIKDDEAYFEQKARAEAALKAMDAGVDKLEETFRSAISTGEERVNPEDVLRQAQDEGQDAADEAAETAERAGDAPTLEDLRAEIARYIDKFGVAASVKNMRAIIGCAIDAVPADEIPNAVAKVRLAIDGSPVDPNATAPESLFGDEPAKPFTATKEDVVEALKAYGRKFDGSDDPNKMPLAKEDLPKVFGQVFGAGVTGMGSMPEKTPEAFGKIVAAIREATEQNTFKREIRS